MEVSDFPYGGAMRAKLKSQASVATLGNVILSVVQDLRSNADSEPRHSERSEESLI